MAKHHSTKQPRDKNGRFRPGKVAVGAPPTHAPKPNRSPYGRA